MGLETLETTVDEIAPALLRYCLGASGDTALAEELAQDALTALVQRWRRHGPPDDPAAFVFSIARRRAFRAHFRRRLSTSLELVRIRRPDPAPDPETRAAGRQRLEQVLSSLATLPQRDRDALLLIAAGELDGAQASKVLGISRSAFKMRVMRARRRLSQSLDRRPAKETLHARTPQR